MFFKKKKKFVLAIITVTFVISLFATPLQARAQGVPGAITAEDLDLSHFKSLLTKVIRGESVTNALSGELAAVFGEKLETELEKGVNTLALMKTPWRMVRNVVNLFFVLALVVMAFGTIFDIDKYKFASLFPKFLVSALLINFSFIIADFIVNIANKLTILLSTIATGQALIAIFSKVLTAKFVAETSILGVIAAGTGNPMVIKIIFAIPTIITVGVAIVYLGLWVTFAIRSIVIAILAVLSPLAWFGLTLPAITNATWDLWWKKFMAWVFFGPIYFLILIFGGVVVRGLEPLFTGDGILSALQIDTLIYIILVFYILIWGMFKAFDIAGSLGDGMKWPASILSKGLGYLKKGAYAVNPLKKPWEAAKTTIKERVWDEGISPDNSRLGGVRSILEGVGLDNLVVGETERKRRAARRQDTYARILGYDTEHKESAAQQEAAEGWKKWTEKHKIKPGEWIFGVDTRYERNADGSFVRDSEGKAKAHKEVYVDVRLEDGTTERKFLTGENADAEWAEKISEANLLAGKKSAIGLVQYLQENGYLNADIFERASRAYLGLDSEGNVVGHGNPEALQALGEALKKGNAKSLGDKEVLEMLRGRGRWAYMKDPAATELLVAGAQWLKSPAGDLIVNSDLDVDAFAKMAELAGGIGTNDWWDYLAYFYKKRPDVVAGYLTRIGYYEHELDKEGIPLVGDKKKQMERAIDYVFGKLRAENIYTLPHTAFTSEFDGMEFGKAFSDRVAQLVMERDAQDPTFANKQGNPHYGDAASYVLRLFTDLQTKGQSGGEKSIQALITSLDNLGFSLKQLQEAKFDIRIPDSKFTDAWRPQDESLKVIEKMQFDDKKRRWVVTRRLRITDDRDGTSNDATGTLEIIETAADGTERIIGQEEGVTVKDRNKDIASQP